MQNQADVDRAFATLAEAARDDLHGIIGTDRPHPVSEGAVREAGVILLLDVLERNPGNGFSDLETLGMEEAIALTIRAAKADVFEALWQEEISQKLTDPAERVEVIAWIEARTGRPLPLDPGAYGNEEE